MRGQVSVSQAAFKVQRSGGGESERDREREREGGICIFNEGGHENSDSGRTKHKHTQSSDSGEIRC